MDMSRLNFFYCRAGNVPRLSPVLTLDKDSHEGRAETQNKDDDQSLKSLMVRVIKI